MIVSATRDETGAVYVRLNHAPVASTRELIDGVMVDLSVNGHVVGVEVLTSQPPTKEPA